MDLLSQTALFASVVAFALGLSTLAKNPKNTLFLSFSIMAWTVAAWALSFFAYRTFDIAPAYRLHLAIHVWVSPAAIFFIRILTRPTYSLGKRWIILSTGVATLLTFALAIGQDARPEIVSMIYFSPTLIALQIIFLFFGERRTLKHLSSSARAKRNLIYAGALLVLNTSLLDHVPDAGPVIPVIGNIFLCVYLYFVSQAISHQKILNFWALLTRFLTLAILALLLAALYSSIFNWIKNSFPLFFVHSLIASFLVLMLIDPLKTWMGLATSALFQRNQKKLLQSIHRAETLLQGITTQYHLEQAIRTATIEFFSPEHCDLFLLHDDGRRFQKIQSSTPFPKSHPIMREFSATHPLIEYVQNRISQAKIPIAIDSVIESEADRSVTQTLSQQLRDAAQAFKKIDCNLLIPLVLRKKLLGFLLLKTPPNAGNEHYWGDLDLIYPYYEQAAKTIQSLEFFSKHREKERLAELGQMAAGLAHEIRNPLGAIKGAIQFIDPEQERPEKEFLKIILEETRRLDQVVTRFLEFSKPRPYEFKKIDLNSLVEKTVRNLSPGLPSRVSIQWAPAPQPAWITGDSEQIQQVLVNLLLNSVRATENKPDAKIQISVQAHSHPLDPQKITLAIEDNGSGIPKENIDKIFLPFFTTSHQGTGLGLSISQNIIETHRGRMEVQSEEGLFTRLMIDFPKGESA